MCADTRKQQPNHFLMNKDFKVKLNTRSCGQIEFKE